MGRRAVDILETEPLKAPQFSLGAVSKLMEMTGPEELQRFLRSNGLRATGRAPRSKGKQEGRGGRAWFRVTDLYRIAIAQQLSKDGFGRNLIADVVAEVNDDDDFYGWDENGQLPDLYLILRRGVEKYTVMARRSRTQIKPFQKADIFYVINVAEIITEVQQKIWKLRSSRQEMRNNEANRPEGS
jgi:hypothetical protein